MAATGGGESGGEKLGNEESACPMRELSASAESVLMTELSEQERVRIALIGGLVRVSAEWREYIVKTYRAGNRGGRRMSPAQVAVRVAARAAELEEAEYPSRSTVYRVLRLQVQERERRGQKRSHWGGRG